MVTDSNELLGQSLGTCTLKCLLGRGGMGAVYLAQQSRPRRTVAVKVLLPGIIEQRPRAEFLARFRREADAIAALDHINIMPVYEYGEQGETAFLVMPYVTGGTLRDVLEKRGSLSMAEVVPIVEQAAAGLDTAHSQSIVHRDLKPGNILFHADGRVVLADFGLAKVLKDVTDAESSNGHLTSIGTIVGTPEYLSPEQGTGDAIDYRTDVYSLGIVLYQMLCGRVPFTGTSPVAIAIKHTIEAAPPLRHFNPDIPANVEAVVMKAIEKSPDKRFNSAGEFAFVLRQAVTEALGGTLGDDSAFKFGSMKHKTPMFLASQTEQPEEKITIPPVQEQVPSMSTMLMESDPGQFHGSATEAAPKLSPQAERIQALPTMVASNEETTIATPQQGRHQGIEIPNKLPQTQPQQPQQQVRVLADQHAIHYPTLQKRPSSRSFWALVVGVVVVIAIVGGTLSTFMLNGSNKPNGNQGNTAKPTQVSPTQTATASNPNPTPTQAILSPIPEPPNNVKGYIGTKLYATNSPGNACDAMGAQWNKSPSASLKCDAGKSLTLNSSDGTPASTLLTKLPKNVPMPANYVIQVEATVNPGSSGQFGVIFRNNPGTFQKGAYTFLLNTGGSWSANAYDEDTGIGNSFANGSLQTNIEKKVIIDIVVSGNQFYLYLNGTLESSANHTSLGFEKGDIGLIAYPGVNINFKNFVLYSTGY